jgi:hypothetical protein
MPEQATYYDERANWSGIPDYMRGGIERYVMRGVPPGSFLSAVFANDLMGAIGKADDTNVACIQAYARFIYNHTPPNCHGNAQIVANWCDAGGLVGMRAKSEAA